MRSESDSVSIPRMELFLTGFQGFSKLAMNVHRNSIFPLEVAATKIVGPLKLMNELSKTIFLK
jgi:hypothetical protein